MLLLCFHSDVRGFPVYTPGVGAATCIKRMGRAYVVYLLSRCSYIASLTEIQKRVGPQAFDQSFENPKNMALKVRLMCLSRLRGLTGSPRYHLIHVTRFAS